MPEIKEDCKKLIHEYAEKVYGKDIADKKSVHGFVRSLARKAVTIQRESGNKIPYEEAVRRAGQEKMSEMESGLIRNKRAFEKQTIQNVRNYKQIEGSKNPVKGLLELTNQIGASQEPWIGNLTTGGTNIGKGLVAHLKDEGLFNIARSTKNESTIARCLFTGEFKDDLNHEAVKAAKIIHEFMGETLPKYFRSVGLDEPSKLEGRIAMNTHDNGKIMGLKINDYLGFAKLKRLIKPDEREKLSRDRWIDYQMQKLDLEKTFPDVINTEEAYKSELRKDFTQRRNRSMGNFDQGDEMKKSTNFSNRIAGQERTYHYKDSDSWISYQKEYGAGNMWDVISSELTQTGKKLGVVSVLGPKVEAGFDYLVKQTKNDYGLDKDKQPTKEWVSTYKKINSNFSLATGAVGNDINYTTAKIVDNAMAFENLTHMGKLLFRVMGPDLAQVAKQSMTLTGENKPSSFINAFKALAVSLPKGKKISGVSDVMDALEIGSHNAIGGTVNRFNLPDVTKGNAFTKLSSLEFMLNGVKAWDKSMISFFTGSWARHLFNNASESFSGLNDQIRSHMQVYGIGSDEWDLMRKNPIKVGSESKFASKQLLTPQSFREVSDEDLIKYGKNTGTLDTKTKPSSEDLNFLRNSLAGNAQRMYADLGSFIITHPDFTMRAQAAVQGQNYSPMMFVLNRLAFQWRGYAMSNYKKTIQKTFESDMTRGQIGTNLLMHGMNLALFGYMGYAARQIAMNKEPTIDLNVVSENMLPSLGYSFDLIKTLTTEPGRFAQELAGPAANTLASFAQYAHDMTQSEDAWSFRHKTKAQMSRDFLAKNFNAVNYPYMIAAYNYIFGKTMSDMFNPGAWESKQDEVQKKTGQAPIMR